MSRGLGKLQRTLLDALLAYDREAEIPGLAYLVEGKIEQLGDDWPWRKEQHFSYATYKATVRAVATLRKRGLVETRIEKYFHERQWQPRLTPLRGYPTGNMTRVLRVRAAKKDISVAA
jgi:hypothetical protein